MKSNMPDIDAQYIVDKQGKKTAVVLNVDVFERLLEELEDLYLGKLAESVLEADKERHTLEAVKKELLGDD